MKTVIFIGGTSRSGSTLLDQIIANDPNAMSIGEIHALFHTTRKHHFEELQNLKNDPIWSIIIKDGKKNLFPNLFKYFPDVDFFVDSSQDPFWFAYHQKVKKDNYTIKNILIYKSPAELAKSFLKRGNKTWGRTYVHYHKKYFSVISNFYAIPYKELITDDDVLRKTCNYLGIDYFREKKKYWESERHTFFGSNSVRSTKALAAEQQLKKHERKDLTYDAPDIQVVKHTKDEIKKKPEIKRIHDVLENKKIDNSSKDKIIETKYMYSKLIMKLISFKSKIIRLYRYHFPKDLFADKRKHK